MKKYVYVCLFMMSQADAAQPRVLSLDEVPFRVFTDRENRKCFVCLECLKTNPDSRHIINLHRRFASHAACISKKLIIPYIFFCDQCGTSFENNPPLSTITAHLEKCAHLTRLPLHYPLDICNVNGLVEKNSSAIGLHFLMLHTRNTYTALKALPMQQQIPLMQLLLAPIQNSQQKSDYVQQPHIQSSILQLAGGFESLITLFTVWKKIIDVDTVSSIYKEDNYTYICDFLNYAQPIHTQLFNAMYTAITITQKNAYLVNPANQPPIVFQSGQPYGNSSSKRPRLLGRNE